jgi:hypothetical protein
VTVITKSLVGSQPGWITNSPEAARALRAADAAYDRALAAAAGLRLAEKVEAIRAARAARDATYRAVMERE